MLLPCLGLLTKSHIRGYILQSPHQHENRCQIFESIFVLFHHSREISFWTTQVLGRLFAPSQKSKKLSHHFRVCFELGIGILNAPRKIFLVVYEPILKLQGLVAVEFQGKNGFTKMASNFSKIDCGFT